MSNDRMPQRRESRHPITGVMVLFCVSVAAVVGSIVAPVDAAPPTEPSDTVWTTAYPVPKHTTSEGSGYFSIVEGHDRRIYIGTAKYRENAYLVAFDPTTKAMKVVVDAHAAIGAEATGFAAQAKIHTRNAVGRSGRIYFGTKQGYPRDGEKRSDYPGGYPMWHDPVTGRTRVYDIPVEHHGIISIVPDERRGVAYLSTSSDERPIDSTRFMVLDLRTGTCRDLGDMRHMYAFIVIDHRGRAYHPMLGGRIARYDPETKRLARLEQAIDGRPPADAPEGSADRLLAASKSHPVNWDTSPDGRTLWSVAMRGNQLFSYDLTGDDPSEPLAGRSHGPLIADATKTDCRAMCVGPDGTVWAGVAATTPRFGKRLHLVSYRTGEDAPTDHGPVAVFNPDYTRFTDDAGEPLPHHHGVTRSKGGTLVPRYHVMGICAARDGTVYLTTLYPLTLHAVRSPRATADKATAANERDQPNRVPRVAAVVTAYYRNSHADVIVSRLMRGQHLNDQPPYPKLKLASLYIDQDPREDIGRPLAEKHGVPVYDNVGDALTLGGETLAVDGVLLIAEHGRYPRSPTGQIVYPKRRLFGEVAAVFERSGRAVPVFCDKHLADNWADAKWLHNTAERLRAPLMAGSSLPVLWRLPPVDVRRGAKLEQIVAVSYHTLDAYGFHALEMVQSLVERRAGGETGVRSVRCIDGEAVWQAGRDGVYDPALLTEALTRLRERPLKPGQSVEDRVKKPVLMIVDYDDGLRACVLTLNGAVVEWAAAWRYAAEDPLSPKRVDSTLFWTQEDGPYTHFAHLLRGIERMVHTGEPIWPAERTLLTSGTLDALLISKQRGKRVDTPHLDIRYRTPWDWRQPPPPPGRQPRGPNPWRTTPNTTIRPEHTR